MNQATLTHLVSKLPIRVSQRARKMRTVEGLYGRLKMMRRTVTALIRHERIELNYPRADEARGYAERIISDAIRYGDCHKPTMDQAKFWIDDPALVPKLFNVLVPRYQRWSPGLPYTRLLRAPGDLKEIPHGAKENVRPIFREKAVMELRGNPYPPLPGPMAKPHPGEIHNVLLEEARKDYFKSMSPLSLQAETLVQSHEEEETKSVQLNNIDEPADNESLIQPPVEDRQGPVSPIERPNSSSTTSQS